MKKRNKRSITVLQIIPILWGLFSIICVLSILFFLNKHYTLQTNQVLQSTAEQISEQVDHLIDRILTEVHEMPLDEHAPTQCQNKLLPSMQRLQFNNPDISAVVIRDNHQHVVCSTLSQGDNLTLPNSKFITFFGPIQFDAQKPAYVIHVPLGNYTVDAYLLRQVLERKLTTDLAEARMLALYDNQNKQSILQLTRKHWDDPWQISKAPDVVQPDALTTWGYTLLRRTLNNIPNFQVLLLIDGNALEARNFYLNVLASILVLLVLGTLYYQVRKLITRHFSIQRSLYYAMKNREFFPVYQPVLDSETETLYGAEMLLRWRTNSQEVIMPNFFIEDAEKSGLIVPITLQLIEIAFNECRSLLKQYPRFHLGINISASHFVNEDFLNTLLSLCEHYQINTSQVMLEITERELLNKENLSIVNQMKTLRAKGFSLAIDDFGTGHASISYLQHFPFNYLKIDQIFIQSIGTGAITESLNDAIIHLAKCLNLNIIAEGVETFQQVQFLLAHDVRLMQGWYFAGVTSVDQLMQLMKGVQDETIIPQ